MTSIETDPLSLGTFTLIYTEKSKEEHSLAAREKLLMHVLSTGRRCNGIGGFNERSMIPSSGCVGLADVMIMELRRKPQ